MSSACDATSSNVIESLCDMEGGCGQGEGNSGTLGKFNVKKNMEWEISKSIIYCRKNVIVDLGGGGGGPGVNSFSTFSMPRKGNCTSTFCL